MESKRGLRSSYNKRRNLLQPNSLHLEVQGMTLTPNRSRAGSEEDLSSNRTSVSETDEDEVVSDNSYTALDGLRDVNHGLLKQIDTLRLKIQIDEKNNRATRERLELETDGKLEKKDNQINDLQGCITSRDERIRKLESETLTKDKDIENKCDEIASLKKVVKRTQEYARRLNQAITKLKTQKSTEGDENQKEKDEEIRKINGEMEIMQSRFGTLEEELKRAMETIEDQNLNIKALHEDRERMYAKFREDLAEEKKRMNEEIERMRELMHLHFKEVKALREQHQKMSEDITFIRECFQKQLEEKARSDLEERNSRPRHQRQSIQGRNIDMSVNHESSRPKPSKQPAAMSDYSRSQASSARSSRNESTRMSYPQSPYSELPIVIPPETSRSSPDKSARPWTGKGDSSVTRTSYPNNSSHPNAPQYSSRDSCKNFPPIAGLREGTVSRGGRVANRRGYLARK